MQAVLTTAALEIGYRPSRRERRVIGSPLDLTLQAGQLVCLLGPNGAGKSTLLRTLAGMQPPLGGTLLLDGTPLEELDPRSVARRLSVVLTERIDVGMLDVYTLVGLGRQPHTDWTGRLRAADHTAIQNAIAAVGAADLTHRHVGDLSDGERQKVMIARALAQAPQLMILDEPTAFLDLPRRAEIMQILRRLAHESGCAVILSTHDLDLALRSADHIWLMDQEGALAQGTPEDLVLTGRFAAAFARDGVQFDAVNGAFHIAQTKLDTIDLTGNGVGAIWTARALERAGFAVHQGLNGATRQVSVADDGESRVWRLQTSETASDHDSIDSLLAALKTQHAPDR